ncbi:MAG: NAD(P)/FAD-dependent oxidoreductase [Sphingomonadaceae bacterium]|nr:NAD(P)/FAD-dependent oxidoreductase [Sphingomonadaceae bacterium]
MILSEVQDLATVVGTTAVPAEADIVVIGAGFGGMYAHHRFRQLGMSVFGFEQGTDVGGTWYWNRYPGARCDVESVDYCYTFSRELLDEWQWTERFARQDEILRYANFVAEKFDLKRDIKFQSKITAARYDEGRNRWTVETDKGESISCKYLVTTVGCLSVPKDPDFKGLEDFKGQWIQTGAWPKENVNWDGKNVAVIGTGSSAIQSIPEIAKTAKQLTVFQRTANYSVPAYNGPLPEERRKEVFEDYPAYLDKLKRSRSGQIFELSTDRTAADFTEAERNDRMEHAWKLGRWNLQSCFRDTTLNQNANDIAANFVHAKIRETVNDPNVAEKLIPKGYPFGTKRLCLDTDYFATFNRDTVELVDIKTEPIERITATGIQTSAGEYPVDLIVFAIGFDAVTGPIVNLGIEGRGGVSLSEAWADGPISYLGLAIPGFPNLFTVNGPSSPSVLANMILTLEQHVDWIADCINAMNQQGINIIETDESAAADWAEHTRTVANQTLFPKANSWYMGANVPGKPSMFLAYIGGFDNYIARCDHIAANGYAGFSLSKSKVGAEA